MARKLPRLQRVLDAPALASIAYSEVASSIYFALGIIAEEALGLTPAVLLLTGLLFLLVALSYAEGTAAIPETGGAATFTRIAFNDFAGFATGWVLFLDYLIVIALSALFLPHYLGYAFHLDGLEGEPWDVVAAVGVVTGITAVRLVRRPSLHRIGLVVAVVRPRHPGDARRARLRPALLRRPADARDLGGRRAVVAPARVRAAARDARLHRARDGREPRRGGARAGPRPAAQPLQRAQRRGRDLRADRDRRALGVPGRERRHGARHDVGRGAADGDRLGAARGAAGLARRHAQRLRRGHGRPDPADGGHDLRLRDRQARLLARRARPAAAAVRAPEPAHAHLAGRARSRRR